ncbi:796_t:CDS:2, partial [Entrophospora sp. SA101]
IFKCVYESEELLNVSFRSGNGYDSSASSDIRTSLEEHVRQLHHGKNTDENKIVLEEYQVLFFETWKNQSTTIELNIALKNLYPTEHVFNRREIETWRAMLNATGRTKMSPFERNHSKASHNNKKKNNSEKCKYTSSQIFQE